MARALPPLVFVAFVVMVWQLISMAAGEHLVSAPLATGLQLAMMLQRPSFWLDVIETGIATGYAVVISAALGWALGVVLGLSQTVTSVGEPFLVTFYALPKVTLYPIVLSLFGLGVSAKVAFGVMHALVPIALLTSNAIRQLNPVYLKTARVMRLDAFALVHSVILPAIVPDLIAGLRIGISLSILGVLIGEMFAAKRGLGFAAVNAMGLGDVTSIMAIGLFLAGAAVSVNFALLELESRVRHTSSEG